MFINYVKLIMKAKLLTFFSGNLHVFLMNLETSRAFKEVLLLAQEYNINHKIFMLLTYTVS